jgi:hypothetical protein
MSGFKNGSFGRPESEAFRVRQFWGIHGGGTCLTTLAAQHIGAISENQQQNVCNLLNKTFELMKLFCFFYPISFFEGEADLDKTF